MKDWLKKDGAMPLHGAHPLGQWLKRHRIGLTIGLLSLGLALSWNWLAASGLLLAVLVGLGCVAMCGIGAVCGHRKDGGQD